jgi:bifunctional DNase/RNase
MPDDQPPVDASEQHSEFAREPGEANRDDTASEDPTRPVLAHFRIVELIAVAVDLPSQFPVVTLQESEPPFRQLELPIGMAEGVALSHASKGIDTPRPLTHHLFAQVLSRFHIDLVAVRLVGRTRGTYLGELDLMGTRGREVVPCRPSDGLSLAFRFPVRVPLLADERLFDEEGDVDPI